MMGTIKSKQEDDKFNKRLQELQDQGMDYLEALRQTKEELDSKLVGGFR